MPRSPRSRRSPRRSGTRRERSCGASRRSLARRCRGGHGAERRTASGCFAHRLDEVDDRSRSIVVGVDRRPMDPVRPLDTAACRVEPMAEIASIILRHTGPRRRKGRRLGFIDRSVLGYEIDAASEDGHKVFLHGETGEPRRMLGVERDRHVHVAGGANAVAEDGAEKGRAAHVMALGNVSHLAARSGRSRSARGLRPRDLGTDAPGLHRESTSYHRCGSASSRRAATTRSSIGTAGSPGTRAAAAWASAGV